MESPGELIRDARRRRGLSPEEVFRIARVRPGLLEKVEEDVLTALPEDPYARGLYASLARAVGADVQKVLAAYDHLRESRTVAPFREPVREEPPAPVASPRPLALVGGIAAVVVIAAVVWIVSHHGAGTGGSGARESDVARDVTTGAVPAADEAAPTVTNSTRPDSFAASSSEAPLVARAMPPAPAGPGAADGQTAGGAPAAAPSGEGAGDAEDLPPPPPTDVRAGSAADSAGPAAGDSLAVLIQRVRSPRDEGGTAPTPGGATVQPLDSDTPALPGVNAAGRELVLEARARRSTWIRVVIDGERTRAGILPAGETRSWRGRSVLRIDVAAIEGVDFRLNGRPIDAGEPRHGVDHFVLGWKTP